MSDHFVEVRNGPQARVRVYLNTLLVHEGMNPEGSNGTTMPVDRFLLPGSNQFRVDIVSGDIAHPGSFMVASLCRFSDCTALAEVDWSSLSAEAGGASAPLSRTVSVVLPSERKRPVWADAPSVGEVPQQGNAQLMAPIDELTGALQTGNVSGVALALTLRGAEYHRMENVVGMSPDAYQARIEEVIKGPFVMRQNQPGDLIFKACADNRVVQVTRADGTPAIAGESVASPKVQYATNPFLVMHQGRYQIFS